MHNTNIKRIALKALKIISISVIALLALLFLLPILFPNTVSNKIKTWTNNSITGDLNFSKARLSFFNHFPSLTLTLYDFSLKGAPPFQTDTLISANEVALGINLSSVFSNSINIDEIYLTKGNIHVLVDTAGHPNYNVYKSSPAAATSQPDSGSANLKIARIQLDHCNILYNDQSLPMYIQAKEVNYLGKGDLSKAQFDLYSKISIGLFDLSYANTSYILSKKLNGELITKINTNSLDFIFEKNDLKINELPVRFNGAFGFLKNGYKMDFRLSSMESELHAIFGALPPAYATWAEHMNITGTADVNATLIGQYIAESNTMPDITFNMKVRNGTVTNDKAPAPVKNLFLNFQSTLAQLNTDSLYVNVDSIFFNIDKDYFSSVIRIKGLKTPDVHVKMNTDIDLHKWNQALGLKDLDLRGRLQAHLQADGRYAKSVVYKGLQKRADTVISSIPVFHFDATLRDGYFKFASLPEAVNNISFNANAACPDGNYTHTHFDITDINANMLSNYLKGYLRLSNAQQPLIDAKLESVLHMSDLKKVYPMDSLDMTGDLALNVATKGTYLPAKRLFPVTTAKLTMNNGTVQTKYYPHPVEKINIDATVTNTTGNMRSLQVNLKPVSFEFEGQPFVLKADLNNFDNLRYNIASNGVIDLGRIYQVFAIRGYDLKGFIKTNLQLQGTQNAATSGRYNELNNKGTLTLKNIALVSDLFPLPFLINNGVFRFDQDKMWFDQFNGSYGKSLINLNGYLSNVIAYATQTNQPLRGNFDLKSGYILVDEMMVNGSNAAVKSAPTAPSGVVMVPGNLALTLNATADKIHFKGIDINSFHGQLVIDSSKIKLNQTGFTIIGAPVEMDATYASLQPKSARFDYHISAKEFDIKRAYNEIKIFHDMASSASYASGIVGLDYTIGGKLDQNMNPVYPSLKGGGVLSVKKIKLKGFKLMNAVSSSTGKGDIKDPDLSQVDIKTTINNNIITINRTKMRIAGFRPRFEGQVSLDGKLNLKGRVGLPPFGIFGIPFSVTGTQDNPKIKLRRGSDKDKLEETQEEPNEEDQHQ
ncbi:AsmA family protein [Chitinophaga arvensicola]|uniref:AsmA protein n=1 Tax=Chitinophaga arvensicola TaxID=29529 RepID=A0A1I0SA20_9BACT|nr:AsmA-like C-terminal region-containing protein [Chitinophaga arvensicola]SEW53094.1 AsmA protein [Chitinophaga arvensicola]